MAAPKGRHERQDKRKDLQTAQQHKQAVNPLDTDGQVGQRIIGPNVWPMDGPALLNADTDIDNDSSNGSPCAAIRNVPTTMMTM